MENGEIGLRRAFETTTRRNVQASVDHGNTTRKLLRDAEERIKYLEGASGSIEFYVEGVKRKMNYPETMTTTYSVTRGYEYGSKTDTVEGITFTTPQVKKITQLGRKLIQTEKDQIYSGQGGL